jgi:hypothetical protein
MRTGDIKVSRKGRTVVIAIRVWAKRLRKNDIQIHVSSHNKYIKHVTISGKRSSKRYNRILYRNLKNLLVEHKKWPLEKDKLLQQ